MDTREFVVPVHDLDVAGRPFRFELTHKWLAHVLEGCEMQPVGPNGVAEVELSKTGTDIFVRGKIVVDLKVPCARCLTIVQFRPDMELALVLEPASGRAVTLPSNVRHLPDLKPRRHPDELHKGGAAAKAKAGKVKDPSRVARHGGGAKAHAESLDSDVDPLEGADRDTYDGEEVVLDRFIREALLLEAPIFPLCSESCEGIRPAQASDPSLGEGGGSEPRICVRIQPDDRRNSKE